MMVGHMFQVLEQLLTRTINDVAKTMGKKSGFQGSGMLERD